MLVSRLLRGRWVPKICGANIQNKYEEAPCLACSYPLYVGDSCYWLVANGEDIDGPFCSTTCSEKNMPTFGMNVCTEKHTRESEFSYFEGTDEELLALVAAAWDDRIPINEEPGIYSVPVDPSRFMTPVREKIVGEVITGTYKPREKGEEPVTHYKADGTKIPAVTANMIVYSHAALGDEASTTCDYEVVSENAENDTGRSPLDPISMHRNQMDLPGGTKQMYTSEQWCDSVGFWDKHIKVY